MVLAELMLLMSWSSEYIVHCLGLSPVLSVRPTDQGDRPITGSVGVARRAERQLFLRRDVWSRGVYHQYILYHTEWTAVRIQQQTTA